MHIGILRTSVCVYRLTVCLLPSFVRRLGTKSYFGCLSPPLTFLCAEILELLISLCHASLGVGIMKFINKVCKSLRLVPITWQNI